MYKIDNPYKPRTDEYYMYEALRESLKGIGWTSPNPLVGCVIVNKGEIVSRGHHETFGDVHAEVMSLGNAKLPVIDSTAYVTLEPCTHIGHQGSCCSALAEAGVRRVVFSLTDIDSRTSGKAADFLENHQIEVTEGVLAECTRRLLDDYFTHKSESRPFVHLKLAMSLDAKIACANGVSQWLSGPESHGYAHFLRQKYDAVLVGIGTAESDDPRLTVRAETLAGYPYSVESCHLRDPVRVIVDPEFRSLQKLNSLAVFDTSAMTPRPHLPQIVVAGSSDMLPAEPDPAGVTLLGLDQTAGRLQFTDLFSALWKLGITSILVEGGSGIAAELLRQDQADKLSLVYVPQIIGGDGLGFTPDLSLTKLDDSIKLRQPVYEILGRDLLASGYLHKQD